MAKCMMCKKDLEVDEHDLVYEGGYVVVSFHYGSRHDQCIGFNHPPQKSKTKKEKLLNSDEIRAYICDDCFENNVDLFDGYRITKKIKEERVV